MTSTPATSRGCWRPESACYAWSATGPLRTRRTGRSSGRGPPDRPRRLLPELAPGPTTARCHRAMAVLWDRAKLGKGPARPTASSASRACARSYNGTLPQGHGSPVGPGEAREGAGQIERVVRFPSLRPVLQRHAATGPWQSCGTGRSSGRGPPDRPRCLLPELAPGPTTARCHRAVAVLWDRATLGKGPDRSTASPASRACARSYQPGLTKIVAAGPGGLQ